MRQKMPAMSVASSAARAGSTAFKKVASLFLFIPMNPNNPGQNPTRPQQRQENNYENQEQHRADIQIRDDKAVVITHVETTFTPEQTVQRYNQLVEQLRNMNKSIVAYEDKIAETLDEHEKVGTFHTLMDSEPQDYPETVPEGEDAVDFFSNQDLQRYQSLKEMEKQIEKLEGQMEQGVEDLDDLYQAARKMGDRHDLEVEDKPDEVREEIGF